jgi:demethylmenaquinone methyltransferase/2-methoxy-6-polyprenyl-1,4-benzoquinol methylase
MAHLSGAARTTYVQDMFARIAPSYDRMNAIMTFGMYRRWQELAAEIASPTWSNRALDVATGTADLAIDLTGFSRKVVGLDFSLPMLRAGIPKIAPHRKSMTLMGGDALALPFKDNSFDCATVGFGIRNVAEIGQAIAEMTRVVQPGGRVVCLELTRPFLPVFRQVFRMFFHQIVPLIGGLVSGEPDAYRYLPQSVDRFPEAEELKTMFGNAGLMYPDYRLLNFGTIAIHWGTKP